MNKTNTSKESSFHIGQLIKNELDNQGRSISWLANQVGCTRENFYKIMRRDWIYTDMLFKNLMLWIMTFSKIARIILITKTVN